MIMLNKKNSLSLSLSQPSHDNTLDIDTIYIEYTNSFIQMYIYIQTKKKRRKKTNIIYTCNTRNVGITWGNSSVYIQVIATGIQNGE